ncbi:hypothetical protein O185_11090 [Photorhabdus temperata J3]|uniref:Uncharacterized protein n=1 Tax=Photorhabdus temperata J3 TaxID=1389415 RepID=U7R0Q1_PHOTE|nr:hypothetical protein O185_11090 [Photorhabdus temperata J3]
MALNKLENGNKMKKNIGRETLPMFFPIVFYSA